MGTATEAPRRPGLMSLEEATARLLGAAVPIEGLQTVPLAQADGRVLARDLVSAIDVPGFDNSAMDGYAVRSVEVAAAIESGQALAVSQRIAAGSAASELQPDSVARLFTGAPIPRGADAVVMQEEVEQGCGGQGQPHARFLRAPEPGSQIRWRGEDVARGETVLAAGTRLGPAEIGLAASLGMAELPVLPRLRVALLSSGDELIAPGAVPPAEMPPGAIYDANRHFLRALLQRFGCEVDDLGVLPDRRDATLAMLAEAARGHDLIVSSGGVSVGEEDHLRPAVQQLGGIALWQVAIKPGKPFAHGWIAREPDPVGGRCQFVGLPGNPVSSFVTFLLLLRPFLLRLQGVQGGLGVQHAAADGLPRRESLAAHFDWPRPNPRREFLRARRNAQGGLDLHPNQGSGVLSSLAWCDGLIDLPAGSTVARGDPVDFIAIDALLR